MTSQSDTGPTAREWFSLRSRRRAQSRVFHRPSVSPLGRAGASAITASRERALSGQWGDCSSAPSSTGADVPILAGPGINEQWLRNQPPPVTEHGQVALQRQGYQVDQRRQLITTTLPDGRRVTVPIDQVQIRYTGNQPFVTRTSSTKKEIDNETSLIRWLAIVLLLSLSTAAAVRSSAAEQSRTARKPRASQLGGQPKQIRIDRAATDPSRPQGTVSHASVSSNPGRYNSNWSRNVQLAVTETTWLVEPCDRTLAWA